jgi:hypothetical protein
MGKKINLTLIEVQRTMIVRDSVEIDVDNYPELDGKTDEEISEYIQENISDMKPLEGSDWADNLYDELMEMDIIREKDLGTDTEIEVEFDEEDDK